MRVIFLAPGLGRVKRGYERFALELAAQLRRAGIDATCWGTSEAPGVEEIPVPGREELWKCASVRLRDDDRFASMAANAFQDWGLYAEDQLFAIPAAARISALLEENEPLVVYAKWQGGLVDPSGAPTQLLKLLASASLKGKAGLLVHTDYVHAPIASLVWRAGGNFHALGPWITEALVRSGLTHDAVVELPMCVDAVDYKNCRGQRKSVRRELGIPEDAFVVLSVGSFDTTTPDKRYAHLLQEFELMPARDRVWWVAAGSRGPAETEWEHKAREAFGERFLPLPNLPFERMPQIYGIADLFALASIDETFGLVYLEAQIAGLPAVIHESPVSRHLCGGLAPEFRAISLVDMRRAGTAAAALERWIDLLQREDTAPLRSALDEFAKQQESRFSWDSIGPQYAAAFRRFSTGFPAERTAERKTERTVAPRDFGTWDEQTHRQALALFEEGKVRDALALFGRALGGRETSERWNDWAAAQMALKRFAEAEQGFRLAVAVDPRHAQAAANLGALLAASGRESEAIPLLIHGSAGVDPAQQEKISLLLADCRAKQLASGVPADEEIASFVRTLVGKNSQSEIRLTEQLPYFSAVLRAIPAAENDGRLLAIGPHAVFLGPAFARWRGYREIRWRAAGGATESEGRHIAVGGTGTAAIFGFDSFEIESAWPYADESFDVVFVGQALETLSRDPMQALAEANRVLKKGGQLLLTAPNLASAHAVHAVLHGRAPYVDGRFPSGGAASAERHNREYAPGEIERLAKAAGFRTIRLETRDVFWEPPDKVFPALAASGYPVGARGDTIVLLARKDALVSDRFPAALYDLPPSASSHVAGAPAPAGKKTVRKNANAAARHDRERPLRILVAHENLPRADQSGAEFRLLQILRELRAQGHAVTYLAARGFEEDRYAPALAELGVEIYSSDAQVLRREGIEIVPGWTLQEVLRAGQFDLAILYLWFWMSVSIPEHYLDEIRRLSPSTRIAVLTDDCHGLREQRGASLNRAWSDRERAQDYQERETDVLHSADLVLAISDDDRARLLGESPDLRIGVVPMVVEPAEKGPDFDAREGLIYLADYWNPASRDGIEWYFKHVAPLVHKTTRDVHLHLAGANLSAEIGAGYSGVVRTGFVADLAQEFAKRRVFISPTRYGTGIKTKNLHAMACGIPLVTTTIGAEGMALEHEKTALIADSADDFASAVVRLYSDRELWRRLSENGRAHVAEKFSRESLATSLRENLGLARELRAKAYDAGHTWSVRQVDKFFPEVLTYYPPQERTALRLLAYARAAEQLAAAGRRPGGRRQLRHVYSYVPNRVPLDLFFGELRPIAETMERAYRAVGDFESAAEFRRQAREYAPELFPELQAAKSIEAQPAAADSSASGGADGAFKSALPRAEHAARPTGRKLDFSVIVPTYNRRETLAGCLQALAHQSFSPRRFEVIVVDDGSTDGTEAFGRAYDARFEFQYFRQANAGAGAARRLAVENARGKFLLLFNDDTIADRALLAQHWRAHRDLTGGKIAVLGDFRYPEAARNRALTHFLNTEPFLFPQVTLAPGDHSKNAYFIASNLSLRRDAVLSAGSFDPRFRVAEDTELGVRLRQMRFQVRYVPEARAIHDHLQFTLGDLVRRAEQYGRTELLLLRKHPHLLGDGTGPFGRLDVAAIENFRTFIAQQGRDVREAAASLEKFDGLDFSPFFSKPSNGRTAADDIMEAFKVAIPSVFWFHTVRGFLAAWDEHPRSTSEGAGRARTRAEQVPA